MPVDKNLFFLPPNCKHIFKANESNKFLTLDINKQIAKEYPLNTDLSVLEIAQMVRYEHNSSFTRAFKECEHISPAEFMKRF